MKACRMSKVLVLANWEKDGKFNIGNRRNQVRFINLNELTEARDEGSFDF